MEPKKGMSKTLKAVLALAAIGIFGQIIIRAAAAPRDPSGTQLAQAVATSPDWRCNITKADGSMDDRKCDLVELCKDAKFYNDKGVAAEGTGDRAEIQKNADALAKTLAWMAAYKHTDVERVCNPSTLNAVNPPDPSKELRTVAVPSIRPEAAQCDAQPNDLFKLGTTVSDTALAEIIGKHCSGAVPTSKGDYELNRLGKNFLVELKSTPGGHEVEGVWLK